VHFIVGDAQCFDPETSLRAGRMVAHGRVTPVTLRRRASLLSSNVGACGPASHRLDDPHGDRYAPPGIKMNAVHQTTRPTPIASTPPASHGQATFTEERYSRWLD
jgi:hypothetical protein